MRLLYWGGLILLMLLAFNVSAQTVNVPLEHWAYDFIDRLETKGVFSTVITKSYPLSRTDLAKILVLIESHKNILSTTELNIFEQLKGEFHEELEPLKTQSQSHYYERHLMTWQEDEHKAKVDFEFTQTLDAKSGDQYSSTERISRTTMGGIIRGQLGHYFNFYVRARNTLTKGADIVAEQFDPRQGAPIVMSGKNAYSDDAWAYVTWVRSWFQSEFGRDQLQWGPGRRGSLQISSQNPLFEVLKLKFTFNKFQYTSFHGWLHSGIGPKYLAGHLLELRIKPWLYMSGSETVVYGNRDIEPSYLIPIMPFHVAQHHLGDKDNKSMALAMTLYPHANHKVYFEFFLDDFTTAENPFTYFGNKFAFQIGHRWTNPFSLKDTDINWEYTRIEPYVYTHYDSINIYQNYDKSIGHWLGPNADDLFLELNCLLNRDLRLSLSTERTRHGKGDINTPHFSSEGTRKKFLEGIVETQWSYGISCRDQLFRDVFLSMQYYYVRTNNLNRTPGLSSNDNQASLELLVNW